MISINYRSEPVSHESQNGIDHFELPQDPYFYETPVSPVECFQLSSALDIQETMNTSSTFVGEWEHDNSKMYSAAPSESIESFPDPLDWVEEALGPISYPEMSLFEELPAGLQEIDISDLLPYPTAPQPSGQQFYTEVEPMPLPTEQSIIQSKPIQSTKPKTDELINRYKSLGSKAPSRRGRPMKQTSESKMANYARNYREMKKAQLSASDQLIEQLQADNKQLREENERVLQGYRRLESELRELRSVMGAGQGFSQHQQQYQFVKEVEEDDSSLYY